ncbi:MAG TPA: glycosyltransferase [Candidatus Elarobacter sp.]|jgi:glycosyltransferase involved in cell wall biosynthesis|nr:glycosyltransferase [Candidatus Elarobacter sp.]
MFRFPPADERVPVVSVAMKAYQHERYVGDAIRSVLEQSFQDFELVVTDDGSTDATAEVIASFGDPRIRFDKLTSNGGIAAAMNATVRRARGEFVAILNSDDVALPGRLERQVTFLREHPEIAAVFGVPVRIGESGEPLEGLGSPFAMPFAEPDVPRHAWLRHLFLHGNCLCGPSAMIRRSALEAIGPDDVRLAHLHDLDRWVRLLERHEIRVLDEPFIAFRVRANAANAGAASRATVLRDAFESFQIFKRYRLFDRDFLRAIFAEEIAAHRIDPSLPSVALLGAVALTGGNAWHPLFALDTLFAANRDIRRLHELTASMDVLRIFGAGGAAED